MRLYESYHTRDHIYIVTDLVSGGDLFNYITEQAFLEEFEASIIFRQLIDVVLYVHNSGWVHRDLKPENVLLERDENKRFKKLKLIDFGFAILESQIEEELKQDVPVVGTVNYVAPERIQGKPYDHSSDVFSLGSILYLM